MSVKKSINALEKPGKFVGCFVKGGKLNPAYDRGKVRGDLPKGINFAAYSKSVGKFLFCANGMLYQEDEKYGIMRTFSLKTTPFMVEARTDGIADAFIISADTGIKFTDGEFYYLELGANLSCGVMHRGRLFGADSVDGLTVRWSATEISEFWTEGLNESGYMKLDPERGKVLDMAVFKGKIVAVREYGLTVINACGGPENFSVDITDTDCDAIYKNTVQTYGGKLYFYSESGLKCFDGSKIAPIEIRHAVTKPQHSAQYAGRYYVTGTSKDTGGSVILCVELTGGESSLIESRADAVYVRDGVYFILNDSVYRISEGSRYSFESEALDFGTGRLKTVTKIEVRGTADISLFNGREMREFKDANGIIHPHMRGQFFVLAISGDTPLEAVTVTAEVTDAI